MIRFLLFFFLIVSLVIGQIDIGVKKTHKTKKPKVARDPSAKSSSTTTSSDGYTEKVQAYQNLEYKGTVSVGQPPQVFEVIMDTGSDVFWLPKIGCTSSGPDVQYCASGKGLYNPSMSQTATDLHTHFQINYGTGSATGEYYSDQMSFGDATGNHVSVGNIIMGAAEKMTFSDVGILGLSFAQKGDPTPIFELAVQRGVFSQPVFSVYLADCDGDCENGGLIKFGGVDTTNCNAVVGTAKVVGKTPYWLFEMSGISIGGRSIRVSTSLRAIVDTGTSIIAGPIQVIDQIASALGATRTQSAYLVPCNAQLQVEFQISGQMYTVTSTEMVLAGTIATSGGQRYCQLAIDGDDQLDFVILGSPFIRAYCLVHNVQEKTVGFAPVKTTNPNANTGNSGSIGNSGNSANTGGNTGTHPTTSGSNNHGGRGNQNQWPFGNSNGNSNNWPFTNSPWNSPYGQQGQGFGSPWDSPFYGSSSPFENSNNWPFGNKNPFSSGWTSDRNYPWASSSWNMPSDSGFWNLNRPYKK